MRRKKKDIVLILLLILIFGTLVFVSKELLFSISSQQNNKFAYIYDQNHNYEPLFIGDELFSVSKLNYSCSCNDGLTYANENNKNCWFVNINYKNKNYKLNAFDSLDLDDYLKVTFNPYGRVYSGEWKGKNLNCEFRNDNEWSNRFLFEFKSLDFFDMKITDNPFIRIASKEEIPITINNKYQPINGGIWYLIEREQLHLTKDPIIKDIFIKQGQHIYYLDISEEVQSLGELTLYIRGLIKIKSNSVDYTFFDDSIAKMIYNVAPEVKVIRVDGSVSVKELIIKEKNNVYEGIIVLLILSVISGLWIYFKKVKR